MFVCTKVLFAQTALTFRGFIATRDPIWYDEASTPCDTFPVSSSQLFTLAGDLTLVWRWLVGWRIQATLRLSKGVTSVV